MDVEDHQSNHEGELVDLIHAARGRCAAIVINPGAFTHYAWSIHDALAAFEGPVVEVHLSNPNAREAWRHTSVVAPVATGTIAGFGGHGYDLALRAVAAKLADDCAFMYAENARRAVSVYMTESLVHPDRDETFPHRGCDPVGACAPCVRSPRPRCRAPRSGGRRFSRHPGRLVRRFDFWAAVASVSDAEAAQIWE